MGYPSSWFWGLSWLRVLYFNPLSTVFWTLYLLDPNPNVDPPTIRPRVIGVIEYLINQQPIATTTLMIPVSEGGLIVSE
jgi:hypothetical protein